MLGAYVKGVMVGFAMGLPGYRDGTAYLHSHMLAVLPEFRNAGLGRRLKLAQRDDAMARGYELMEWTFDPLEIKNAYLGRELQAIPGGFLRTVQFALAGWIAHGSPLCGVVAAIAACGADAARRTGGG